MATILRDDRGVHTIIARLEIGGKWKCVQLAYMIKNGEPFLTAYVDGSKPDKIMSFAAWNEYFSGTILNGTPAWNSAKIDMQPDEKQEEQKPQPEQATSLF